MREARGPQYLQVASPDCGCRVVGGEQQSPAACSSWHPQVPPSPLSALGNSCSTQWGRLGLSHSVMHSGLETDGRSGALGPFWEGKPREEGQPAVRQNVKLTAHEPPHDGAAWTGRQQERLQSSKPARV